MLTLLPCPTGAPGGLAAIRGTIPRPVSLGGTGWRCNGFVNVAACDGDERARLLTMWRALRAKSGEVSRPSTDRPRPGRQPSYGSYPRGRRLPSNAYATEPTRAVPEALTCALGKIKPVCSPGA